MQNEIRKILNGMDIKGDKQNTETKANELYKKGKDALFYVIDLGLQLKTKSLDSKTKTLLRSVIFTISIFYKNNKTNLRKSSRFKELNNLLIDLSFLGFKSAQNLLFDMDFSEFDIYRKKLFDLPQVDRHKHDKEISTYEAFEEIRMSKNYFGSKGFKKDHYTLGNDAKRIYEIYRIDKKLFSLRTRRNN